MPFCLFVNIFFLFRQKIVELRLVCYSVRCNKMLKKMGKLSSIDLKKSSDAMVTCVRQILGGPTSFDSFESTYECFFSNMNQQIFSFTLN